MPASTFASAPAPTHLRLFGEGVDIALQYFNAGTKENLPSLTKLARAWAVRYHGHHAPPKVPLPANHDFFETFPHAFNLNIEAGIRLVPNKMVSPVRSPRQPSLEPSPALASDEEMDNVVDLRTRRPHPSEARVKPEMRVNAGMLRHSGLLDKLPEFLEQLAKANTETQAELANKPGGSGFELGDDEAANQPHIAMDVYAGLIKPERRRRHARGIALPADFDSANDGDQSSDAESVGSASTFNSIAPPSSQKRKAIDDDDRSVSPAVSTSSGSSSSSGGPTRYIKIKVPKSLRSGSQSSESSSDASSKTGKNIIKLKSPSKTTLSASPAAFISPTQPTKSRPSPRIVIKRRGSPSSVSPPADKTVADDTQASDSSQRPQKKIKLVLRSSSRDAERSSKRPSSKKL
jgi:hypothetical protein